MKKKLSLLLAIMLCVLSALTAADFTFVFGDLDQHGEILAGFLPSYVKLGAGYTGLTLIDGNTTEIALLLGGGYSQRKVWQDPESGVVVDHNPIVYDTIRADWELRFEQGFLASTVPGKDLLTLRTSYLGRYDGNKDSMVKGKTRPNNGNYEILGLADRLGSSYDGAIYPDLRGDGNHLGTALYMRLLLDMMDDQGMYSNGYLASLALEWAPRALNSALDGVADYYSITFNTVGAYTPVSFIENGQHLFSVTLIDRFNVNWTDGGDVPVYAQAPASLGRKVRGFNTWTYNTQFSLVNNFDVRLAGPDWNSIFPRINFFFDMGYGCGNYFNTDISGSNFLMSTGVQVTVSFFDFIDLGYEISYLFKGYKFTEGPTANVVGTFTFFLDF